ncbi:hypothetical protein [uncultured Mucilaginibacter sp.]|uniref:hypothetical protein n=1 Tax=uncultured Mucilaginibacter sp. TaxID=797541 RepID=UPI0025DF4940|nr:hypothetical protein [uncultured Mucilaginibacter sp.]
MKNFKQIALGLLVGAMAIGFSSFTNAPKSAYKVSKLPNGKLVVTADYFRKVANAGSSVDSDPSHYIFRDNTTAAQCLDNPDNICSVTWQTDSAPSNNDEPASLGSPSLQGTAAFGDYNGQ